MIADSENGWAMLQALAAVYESIPIPVHLRQRRDAQPARPEIVIDLPAEFRAAIVGVSPVVPPDVRFEPPGAYATNALDCLNLIALRSSRPPRTNPPRSPKR